MKKLFLSLICIVLLAGALPIAVSAEEATAIPPNLTADELISRMRTGWNLGNTFDAWSAPGSRLTGDIADLETMWIGGSNMQTTQLLIQEIRGLGFDVLRIPVTWSKVADPEDNWQIREDWMARVQQVVDWALEEDMFVILNTHHENAALQLQIEYAYQNSHPGNEFVVNVWRQIAEHFRDYDERLIFASLNEPRHEGGEQEWWGATQTVRDNVNYLNQAFVNTVRASGGNNVYRILQVPTVAAGATPNGMSDFIVPDDPLNDVNKLVWSIHTYSPFRWAHDGRGVYEGAGDIVSALDNVQTNAERLGLPVLLGEWGSIRVSIGEDADQDLRDYHRPQHAEDYIREARERGMVAVWWDNGGFTGSDHTFGLIHRAYPHWIFDHHQELINGIMAGAGALEYIREIPDPEPEPEPDEADDVPAVDTADPTDDISDDAENLASTETPVDESDNGGSSLLWVLAIGMVAVSIFFVVFILSKNRAGK